MPGRSIRSVLAACTISVIGLMTAPAQAAVTEGSCNGSVTIKGTTYTPANDTKDNPILVPDEAGVVITYDGTTGGAVIQNYEGSIAVVVGPTAIDVADWNGVNEKEDTEAHGSYDLDQAWEKLGTEVVGIYRVNGEHTGKGGTCKGFAFVKIAGNPLTTIPGAVATGGAVLAGAGVLAAGRARRTGKNLKPRH